MTKAQLSVNSTEYIMEKAKLKTPYISGDNCPYHSLFATSVLLLQIDQKGWKNNGHTEMVRKINRRGKEKKEKKQKTIYTHLPI